MKYYQYELDGENKIIAIHSSNTQFNERSITLEQIKQVRLGKTTEAELLAMV